MQTASLSWTPKTGQAGSLTQAQESNPHVQETTYAQSRTESLSEVLCCGSVLARVARRGAMISGIRECFNAFAYATPILRIKKMLRFHSRSVTLNNSECPFAQLPSPVRPI